MKCLKDKRGHVRIENVYTMVVVVFLLCNVLAGIITISLTVISQRRKPVYGQHTSYLHCNVDDDNSVQRRPNQGVDICSAQEVYNFLKETYVSLLEERSRSWKEKEKVKVRRKRSSLLKDREPDISFISVSKPVVHLQGLKYKHAPINDSLNHVIRNWNDHKLSDLIFVSNAMTYQDGAITVPIRGSYRVYSHVIFNPNVARRSEMTSQVFEHHVMRHNAEGDVIEGLLSSSQSKCKVIQHNPDEEFSSYMSRVISLNAGDSVFVKTSHFNSLMEDSLSHKHYFGVHFVW